MQRIRLTFDRNLDPETAYYNIYRRTEPKVTSQDRLVMTVAQPASPNLIAISGEQLTRVGPGRYRARHRQWLAEAIPTVLVDGSVPLVGYRVERETGTIYFDEAIDHRLIVSASYHFDGVQVLDHDGEQPGVTFHGPVAYDQAPPGVPATVSLLADDANERVVLMWTAPPSAGTRFFYRIEAVDHEGRKSKLSIEQSALVVENLDSVPFVIERSWDLGGTWTRATRTNKTIFVEQYAGLAPASALTDVSAQVELVLSSGTAGVRFDWTLPAPQRIESPLYRVRAISKNQIISEPSGPVGPVTALAGVEAIVVRRKLWDGAYPTYDGTDAETVAAVPGSDTTFLDTGVPDESTWAYALYVKSGGLVSAPVCVKVEIGDASSPDPVTIVHIEQHQL